MVLANTGSFYYHSNKNIFIRVIIFLYVGNDHVLEELANIKFTEATSRQLLRWMKMCLRPGLLINYNLHGTTVNHYKLMHITSTSFF